MIAPEDPPGFVVGEPAARSPASLIPAYCGPPISCRGPNATMRNQGGGDIDDLVQETVERASAPDGCSALLGRQGASGTPCAIGCTQRAERRYRAVDPDNRLVARGLEREWEERLRDLAAAKLGLGDRFCPPERGEACDLPATLRDLGPLWTH